jgi:hypothetical protein
MNKKISNKYLIFTLAGKYLGIVLYLKLAPFRKMNLQLKILKEKIVSIKYANAFGIQENYRLTLLRFT